MNKRGDAELVYFALFYIILAVIVIFVLFNYVSKMMDEKEPRAKFIAEDVAQVINTFMIVSGDVKLDYVFGEDFFFKIESNERKVYCGTSNFFREYADDTDIIVAQYQPKEKDKLTLNKENGKIFAE